MAPLTSSSIQTDHTQPPADQSSYDPVKPSTFVAPVPGIPYSVIIEFCDRVSPLSAILLIIIHIVTSVAGES
jgi:hypothetical protein